MLCAVYICPGSSAETYQSFATKVHDLRRNNVNANFIIAGDFNLPQISWSYDEHTLVPNYRYELRIEVLLDEFAVMDFQQFNDVTNCSGKILDLVFSDDLSVGVEHAQLCLLSNHSSDPYHPAVEFKFDYKDVILSSHYAKEKVFLFHKADYMGLNEYFSNIDWSFLYYSILIDEAVSAFYEVLSDGFKQYVPQKFKSTAKYPKWYSNHLIELLKLKNKLHKKFKISGLERDYDEYSNIRKETKYHIDMCYILYLSNTELMIHDNIKYFGHL
ncbi:hypothetical protein JTB14_025059 [Gonioctena quinquepunctata]|nr:hypothetical protein JTB14_025059 [Gonioctena quinquepunctata]